MKRNVALTTLLTVFATFGLSGAARTQTRDAAQAQNTKPARYTVINLGTLGGVLGSSAHSINNSGWITGEANLSGDMVEHAALWRDGVVTDLGTLGGDNSTVGFPVKNDAGIVVGFAQTSTIDPMGENFCAFVCTPSGGACNGSNHSCRGFRWRNGVMEPLGTLGGNNSFATGANNRGLVVGSAENGTQDPNCIPPQALDYKPVVWHGGAIHELPVLAGDAVGAAIAVNDNNQAVGATGMCGSGPGILPIPVHAVLWQNGSVTDLGNLGGAVNNIAYAINESGRIVGASDLPGDSTGHAFLWQKGVMTDLGTLPGDFLSIAYGINNKGQVVGESCDVNFNCRASLWQSGVMIDVNTLTLPGSSLYLQVAYDINSQGEIAGIGLDQSSGEPLAFLAVPCGQDGDVQRCTEVAQTQVDIAKPSFVLPDYIRKGLRQRQGLTTALSKIGALRVTSRTSVMQYKGTKKLLPEIGRELNVDSVLEGSVLRDGNRVRSTAQLLRASTDQHLWAESYDRDLKDVLALQSELARSIASQVKITLSPEEESRLHATRAVSSQAHD